MQHLYRLSASSRTASTQFRSVETSAFRGRAAWRLAREYRGRRIGSRGMEGALPGIAEPVVGLQPVAHRNRWIAGGLVLQLIGIGVPVAVVVERAKHDNLLKNPDVYTVRLLWHELLQRHSDVALMVLGVVLFVVGSVL